MRNSYQTSYRLIMTFQSIFQFLMSFRKIKILIIDFLCSSVLVWQRDGFYSIFEAFYLIINKIIKISIKKTSNKLSNFARNEFKCSNENFRKRKIDFFCFEYVLNSSAITFFYFTVNLTPLWILIQRNLQLHLFPYRNNRK